ncbi:S-adenosylhomocysteine-5'-methylthioadenosine nucleosidase protein [Halorhabdus tiamatea SARL4B]|uniref:Potassium channel protein n=1 Tax=Halorhabdus tiamatea SARL4B TaxID=1033806 RepID=F7PMV9_9EURY|nr:NAD-binding protein [Halorhabdus tiamatea]ERJ07666.1 S-adenosylhomocysteine-5'-methylthioadenosine nucleosidase protein [Halorhabdus tiamatea SARL4B]CCQ32677.1 potassium channel protein [Halorhabdus tiamatea SARL4B]
MSRLRRVHYYLGAFAAVTVLYTIAYGAGMAVFEGASRTLTESLLVVVQSFTTTGYGEDATAWTTPQMRLLAIAMQVTGVFFVFMALPLFIAPWIEQRLTTTVPSSVDEIDDHVVICGYTPRTEMLIDELRMLEAAYVVIEPDRDAATDYYEEGITVVHGDPESTDSLAAAGIESARALVADVDDEINASIALAVGQLAPETRTITFVEDATLADYHRYAGADQVFTPRHLIGESLAQKATTTVTDDVTDAVEIGDDLEIVEIPIEAGSDLVGTTIRESHIRERTGANVIGAWFRGQFVSSPSPDDRIDARTVLLVAGREAQLHRFQELARAEARRQRRGPVLICGYGEVGSTVKQQVVKAGLPVTVIDLVEKPGVDVVGDATDPETLKEANIDEASSVVLALPEDTTAVFASLVVRQLQPDVEVIVRANETGNVQKLYRAGADYVLALATVSGRMLAATIFGEDVITFDQGVEVVRLPVGALAGRTIASADVRAKTGCTVIAIQRDGELIVDFDPTFSFQSGDEVIVTGPDDRVNAFAALLE